MSVIGRLDGQVDEIIIKPIDRRKRPESDETQASSEETVARPPAAAVNAEQSQDEEKRKARPSDLPVWLL